MFSQTDCNTNRITIYKARMATIMVAIPVVSREDVVITLSIHLGYIPKGTKTLTPELMELIHNHLLPNEEFQSENYDDTEDWIMNEDIVDTLINEAEKTSQVKTRGLYLHEDDSTCHLLGCEVKDYRRHTLSSCDIQKVKDKINIKLLSFGFDTSELDVFFYKAD